MFGLIAALALAAATSEPEVPATTSVVSVGPAAKMTPRLRAILAKSDGETRETAYRITRLRDEYAIVNLRGATPISQEAVTEGGSFDVLTVRMAGTGETRKMWFDLSLVGKAKGTAKRRHH